MEEKDKIKYSEPYNTETFGEGISFERIRRITGFLVGTIDRFNNAKRSEVNDRVKHNIGSEENK